MTEPSPARTAEVDQKLAAITGELLAIARRYDTGDLAANANLMSAALKQAEIRRNVLADGVAALSLTLLRDRHDLFVWGPDRMPQLPHPPGPPGNAWDGTLADISARLVAGIPSLGSGTVAESADAKNLLSQRAMGAIAALAEQDGGDPEERLRLIRDVLRAVALIEQDARDDVS